jgi:hypothetical protein
MKRFVVLSICLLLLGAMTANAAIVNVTGVTTLGDVQVNGTWDTTTGVVDIYLAGLTGTKAGLKVLNNEGAWTTTGGTFGVRPMVATSPLFQNATTFNSYGTYSVENFSTAVSAYANWGRNGSTTGQSSLLNGSWSQGGAVPYDLVPNATAYQNGPFGGTTNGAGLNSSLIAEFLTTSGTTQIDWGTYTPATNKFGFSDGSTEVVAFHLSPVPEPTTLALLGCGLFGLLAYAWRKRK